MDVNKIINETMVNGGYTYNPGGGRFIIGLPRGGIITKDDVILELKTIIAKMIDSKVSFGTWHHEGYIYVDYIISEDDRDIAIQKAKEYNQIAIYDIQNNEEITIIY